MALKPITVSQLNDYISRVLGTDPLLGAVVVKGEIFSLKYHSSGHVYFSIMDTNSKVSCFLPREYAQTLQFPLSDGQEVVLTGAINVYKKNGTYSLYVRHIEVEGEGDLAVAFEQMKAKLQKEGLFDPAHKKPIPQFPKKIGVITSKTGAAVRDILKILQTRNHMVDVVIFPVLVQGDAAAADIAGMIDYVDAHFDDIDTLIVGRGGGSADDLWAFNEEIVARSIYRCSIPVISAVGHEIDFTISDFVADKRAETPTAAAQLAVPDTRELAERLKEMKDYLYVQLSNKLMYHRLYVDNLVSDMRQQLEHKIQERRHSIENLKIVLEENNPLKILDSGYAVMTDDDGQLMRSISQLQQGGHYRVRLKDGYARVLAEEIGSEIHGQDEV
ncbi:MAG: exodeoxyribonuclease VII large subunit [Firmicutes bacterium]|nr:exodeoxyribonuclease VII large subunit [Bacillota bacterium]